MVSFLDVNGNITTKEFCCRFLRKSDTWILRAVVVKQASDEMHSEPVSKGKSRAAQNENADTGTFGREMNRVYGGESISYCFIDYMHFIFVQCSCTKGEREQILENHP